MWNHSVLDFKKCSSLYRNLNLEGQLFFLFMFSLHNQQDDNTTYFMCTPKSHIRMKGNRRETKVCPQNFFCSRFIGKIQRFLHSSTSFLAPSFEGGRKILACIYEQSIFTNGQTTVLTLSHALMKGNCSDHSFCRERNRKVIYISIT